MVRITNVLDNSYASRSDIHTDDVLLSINGNDINDVLDYRFYLADTALELILTRDGERIEVNIFKDEYDDIGLEFETPLMDIKHSCKNKCIFCFIDQLPDGMRDTLYFKDDDSRLSFLHGNYITLTNMTDSDVDRIISMHISPVRVSVHTTNPELRVKMMKNKRAGEVLSYLDRFARSGIKLHAQIVLCRGVNDGEELVRSLEDMEKYYPSLESLSVVPAGLTKFRDGLYPLSHFTPNEAREIIDIVDTAALRCKQRYGTRLFYCADELYLRAGLDIPGEDYYEDYTQIENGVGMLRSLISEFDAEYSYIDEYPLSDIKREVSIATGEASYQYIKNIATIIESKCLGLKCHVYKIVNDFFGHSITVSGLLTGVDMYTQLADKCLGEELLIPENTLKADEERFLCDMTLGELCRKLNVRVTPVRNDGACLLEAILGIKYEDIK